MATTPIGKDASHKSKTGKVEKQGHTAGPYGNDPSVQAKGVANNPPRDLSLK